ncbi:MAG: PHP domain-containing protein [Acidimicrobiales bacterium]
MGIPGPGSGGRARSGAITLGGMVDLHTHSNVSDGSDTPEEVLELAVKAGLSALALTDHDRQDGVGAARRRAEEAGIELVPGVEISCNHTGTMHVLVYFLEPGEGPLQDELARLQVARDTRNQRLVARLAELGLPLSMEELEAEAGPTGAGRPHVAAIMVRKGYARSIQDAFDRFLAKGSPAYMEKERLDPLPAIALALQSGALPVLAHPLSLQLSPSQTESAVQELAGAGLVGLEAIYGRYGQEERAGLAVLAARAGLAVTGGSDHHGTYKPDLTVGTGRGDLHVPDGALAALRDRLPA